MQKAFTMVFGAVFFLDLQLLVEALNHLFRELRLADSLVATGAKRCPS